MCNNNLNNHDVKITDDKIISLENITITMSISRLLPNPTMLSRMKFLGGEGVLLQYCSACLPCETQLWF